MANTISSNSSLSSSHDSEVDWQTLYTILNSLATRAVYTLRVSLWYGQERDIVEDVVQETLLRLLERIRKGERGEATPISQVERMAAVIAFNCCRDLRRHDRRVIHFPASLAEFEEHHYTNRSRGDCSEEATEQVFEDALFSLLAHEVLRFPDEQRRALLTELANMMFFDTHPSPLQGAFLAVGIDLRTYQQSLTTKTFKSRSQHTALLYWAFKRMTQLSSVEAYISVEERNLKEKEIMDSPLLNQDKGQEKESDSYVLVRMDQKDDRTPDSEQDMEALMRNVSEPYQTVLRLHHLQKYTYTQIANQLQMSKGTVKSQVSRGMKMLNECMEQQYTRAEMHQASQNEEEQDGIAAQIAKLPEPYQVVMQLHCIKRCTYAQIANQLQMSKGTVKSQVSRGMKMLACEKIAV